MKYDDWKQGISGEARGNGTKQGAQRDVPGKVTLTSKQSPGRARKDGGPADGYFEATVNGPDGIPLRIQGWFKETAAGRKEITSHAPRYDDTWPVATKEAW